VLGLLKLHLFTEAKNQEGKWVAEAAHTFKETPAPVSGRMIPSMDEAPCPQHLPLFGLLSEGAWESLPWSCWQRGLPDDASPQIRALSMEWEDEAFGHNFLTLQELSEKYAQLMVDPRQMARPVEYSLAEMLYALTMTAAPSVKAEDRRVVFWFH